jgi:chloramphenicol-sensitive protein RarD
VYDSRRGLIYGTSAYVLWGLFPLYFPLLEPAGTAEILAQRMVWSLVVVSLILACTHGFGGVRAIVRTPYQFRLLLAAAALITVNWGVYIWSVNSGHVVEASLGYFINPLVTVLLGVFILGERLRRMQWIAVGVGSLAIVVITIDYGRLPWIALTLAASFGLYGLCKKRAAAGAVDSLAVETGAQFLPAIAALIVLGVQGNLAFGHHGAGNTLLLAGAGLITAIPLLLFAAATRRLPLSVMGLLQYLTPVLQFLVGVCIRHEPVPASEYIGFGLVWLALIILSVDGLRGQRRRAAPTELPAARVEVGDAA